mgnify:CR=1 FL=1
MFFEKNHILLSCAVGAFIIYHLLDKQTHIRVLLTRKKYPDKDYNVQEMQEKLKRDYGPWEETKGP